MKQRSSRVIGCPLNAVSILRLIPHGNNAHVRPVSDSGNAGDHARPKVKTVSAFTVRPFL